MYWNKNHKGIKNLFNSGTSENDLGLFYDNMNCDQCSSDDCCILLEGINSPILIEGFSNDSDCIFLEGCNDGLSLNYFLAITSL